MTEPRLRFKVLAGLAALLCALAVVAFHRPLLTIVGLRLVEEDSLEKCDAAVVLSGEEGDGLRTRTAIELYKAGWVEKIVLSGARYPFNHFETDFSLPLALSLGVPRKDLLAVTSFARSTLEEARAMIPAMEREGIRSFIVVTSNYHTRRARRYYLRVARNRMQVLVHATPYADFRPESWWQTRQGLKIFFLEAAKNFSSLVD